MAVPKLIVRSLNDREKVRAFMQKIRPVSASILFEETAVIWLLKPSSRGGASIGKIVIAVDDGAVEDMVDQVWREVIV